MEGELKKCKVCGRELPISHFHKTGFGVTNTCKDCVVKKQKEGRAKKKEERDYEQEIENAKKMRLSDFTPRELLAQLKRWGYDGKLTYPKEVREEVNLASIEI